MNEALAKSRAVENQWNQTLASIVLEGEQNWINAQAFFAGHPIVGNVVLNVSGAGEVLFNQKTGAVTAPGGKVHSAGGNDLAAGAWSVVGEHGPELFKASTAGHVFPNGQTGPMFPARAATSRESNSPAPVILNFDLRGTVGLDQNKLGRVVVDALVSYDRSNGGIPIRTNARG